MNAHGPPRLVARIRAWDRVVPGTLIHGIAHVRWQYLDPGPSVTGVEEVARWMRLIVDSYELSDRRCLVFTTLWGRAGVGGVSSPKPVRGTLS